MTQIIEMSSDNTGRSSGGVGGGRRPYRRSYRRRFRRRSSYYTKAAKLRRQIAKMRFKQSQPKYIKKSKFLLAQIDPFQNNVLGCKIPDSNTYPSHAFRCDDTYPAVTTDANGLRALAYIPTLHGQQIAHTAGTATSWTWSAGYGGTADSQRLNAVVANYTLMRPVAHGLRINCPGATTTMTGNLHIAIVGYSDFNKTTWNLPVNITQMSNCMFYSRYPLAALTQQSVTVVNKFLDCSSTHYRDPNSLTVGSSGEVDVQQNGWAAIVVCVEGAPTALPILEVENVLHIEAIPRIDGLSTATPAAPYDIGVLEGVSRMAGETPAAFTDQGRAGYLSQVATALGQGARDYGNAAFRNVVLPAAYAYGQYAANRAFGFGIPGVTNMRNLSAFAH